MAVFSLLLLLLISSTCYDVFTERNLYNPKAIYLPFSLRRNVRELLKVEPRSSESIECFDGLRALAAFWVIAGHRVNRDFQMLSEPLKLITPYSAFFIRVLRNNSYAVDIFFLMAGVLVTQSTLKALDEKKLNLFNMYVDRYGRYMPTLAVVLLLFASSLPCMLVGCVGDALKEDLQLKIEDCRKYWWSSLLLVQTYVNPTNMCMAATWFLSTDFHLFLLSPLFIFLVWKLKYIAFCLFAVIIATTHLGIFFAYYYQSVSGSTIYYQAHFRIPQFLLGIALGYIMYERKGKNHMQRSAQFIGWILAILLCVTIQITTEIYQQKPFVVAFYYTVQDLVFAALISWTIFVCHHLKSGGIVNWCLSHPLWQPIARMSLSIYIIHYLYILLSIANLEATLLLNFSWLIHIVGGDIIVSILLGAVVYLVIEAPSNLIIKHFLK